MLSIAKYFNDFVFYALDKLILDDYTMSHFFVGRGYYFLRFNFR
ncbi:hypothetical protein KsCSTR_45760 [Candidatus Kuenenia stuttgartiensis]|uniref:Uncharacterized protein n=1 Tax=Kuenenia stuttgartiensis TaxID=174633 RepID=A0A6G7GWR1_KUEST|nr:hypothetical protein KsCSTR_45760 [Candidatus Kuenenia stuttgartiensis]